MERDEMGTFDDLKIRLDALEALVGIYSSWQEPEAKEAPAAV